jgi:TRAP-type C4-dicarboxylate transport system substrate-binding protein
MAVALLAMSPSLVVACGNAGGGTSSGRPMTVKFAEAAATDSLTTEGANYFASQVARATGGKIEVKVYPNAELGPTPSVNKALVGGSIQFTSDSVLDPYVPEVDLLTLPYLFPTEKVADKALNSTGMYDLIWNKFEDKGLKILGVWPTGFSDFFSTRPVRTVQDMKGLKVEVYAPDVQQPVLHTVGANGVNVAYNQVYTSLSTNLIQAVFLPPNLVVPVKWQEAAHFVADLNLSYVTTPLIVSQKFWKSLDPTQQKQIQVAATNTLAYEQQRADYWNTRALNTLKADSSVSITSPDLTPFEKAFKNAYSSVDSKYPGKIAKIQAIVAQAQSGS